MPITLAEKYKDETLSVSNEFLRAKETTNLLQSKIEDLALYHLNKDPKNVEKVDANGQPYTVHAVEVTASEIKLLMGKSNSKLYSYMAKTAVALKFKMIMALNPEDEQFFFRSVYEDVSYQKGTMTIEYNPGVEKLLLDKTKGYTKLSLPILWSMKTNSGYQLAKLLTSYCYMLPKVDLTKSQEEQEVKILHFSASEFKVQLGYVNLNQPDIKKEASKRRPDFDAIVNMEIKPQYASWYDLYKRAVLPGIKEVNEKPHPFIIKELKTDSTGKGSKVKNVWIYFQRRVPGYSASDDNTKTKKTSVVQNTVSGNTVTDVGDDFDNESIMKVLALFEDSDISVKLKEAKLLLQDAEGDIERIKRAYELSKEQDYIRNFIGWMRTAIQNNYEQSVSVANGSAKNAKLVEGIREDNQSLELQETVWNKIKEKEEFKDFLVSLGMTLEMFDLAVESPKEKCELFYDWKVKNARHV